jgi:hypothetical protein
MSIVGDVEMAKPKDFGRKVSLEIDVTKVIRAAATFSDNFNSICSTHRVVVISRR